MADLSFPDQQDGAWRTISDTPPNHYIIKIQSFSQLAKNNIERYASGDFEAGGYKWNLILHPNGNKDKDISDHISLYLLLADVNSLGHASEVRAVFRLFLLDQNRDSYFTLKDTTENGRRFHKMKLECGFDKFLPLAAFTDVANGYLVNDTCVFGAEVYVCRETLVTGKGESLTMVKDPISYKNTWRIDSFSSLIDECVDSKSFIAAGRKWKIQLYPNGKGNGVDNHISLYLTLAEPQSLRLTSKIYAEFTVRLLDQVNRNHYFGTANYWYSASNTTCGWPRFVSHAYFKMSTAGLVVKDICIVEAEVKVHGAASDL